MLLHRRGGLAGKGWESWLQGAVIRPAVGVGVAEGHRHARRPGAKSPPSGKSPASAGAAGLGCPPAPWASQGTMRQAAAHSPLSTGAQGVPGTHKGMELFPIPIPGGGVCNEPRCSTGIGVT